MERLILDLLQHLGLFAIVVIGYGVVQDRLGKARPWIRQTALGVVFGAGGTCVVLHAFVLPSGVLVDGRSVMITLAALFGGTVPALLTGLATGITRAVSGGPVVVGAVIATLALVPAALVCAAVARRMGLTLRAVQLGLAGGFTALVGLAAGSLSALWNGRPFITAEGALPVLAISVLGCAMVGTLLRQQVRRARSERALAVSEAYHRALFTQANDCLFVIDVNDDGEFALRSLNPAAERALALHTADVAGRDPAEVLPADRAAAVVANGRRCIATLEPVSYEEMVEVAGSLRTWNTVLVPLTDKTGAVTGLLATSRDITDYRVLLTNLDVARRQAEEAASAKADFLAAMSHEIRTPMNGIVGYATFLEDLASTAEQRQYTRKLRIACRSLLAIINDVLDLSKFEAGKIEIDTAPFDLHEEIDHVISVLQPAAREKRIALFANVGPGVPVRVVGDADRLRQVLLNLLSNAVKFTSHGSVTLSVAVTAVSPASATVKLVVTDTGVGIPADKHHLLFKKFSQADRRFGGTGLGLAISKHLVEAMGGTIGFQSDSGMGSTFHVTVTFPVAGLTAEVGADHARHAPAGERITGRILLVEDVDMNQELIGRMLRNAGHRVDIAGDGEQALAAVADRAYDLILMDLRMPVLDGFAAAAAIRALPAPAGRTPIVALTATVLPDDVERCREVGMDGHIAKPVEREELLATVQHWLGNTGTRPGGDRPDNPVLAQLEAEMGRAETAHLLDLFLEALPDRLRAAGSDAPDWTRVGEDAHAMVSLAGNLGLSDLMAVSRALSDACRADDHHRASGLLAPFRSSGEAAEAAIRAHRRTLSSTLPAAVTA